jgi:hypothetical protein
MLYHFIIIPIIICICIVSTAIAISFILDSTPYVLPVERCCYRNDAEYNVHVLSTDTI